MTAGGVGALPEKINTGRDFNYFENIDVTGFSFPDLAQAVIRFRGPQRLNFILVSGGPIEYSFNGNNLHGDMTTGTPSEERNFDARMGKKIWFRLAGGGSAAVVRVEAWHIGV